MAPHQRWKKKNEMEYPPLQPHRKEEKILDGVTHRKGKHSSVKVVLTVVPLTSHFTSLVSVTHGNWGPKILNFPTHQHCHGVVIQDHPKQTILLLMHCHRQQPMSLSPCRRHSPHFTSSCRHCTISHHHEKGENSTVSYFERDIDHSPNILLQYIVIIVLLYY